MSKNGKKRGFGGLLLDFFWCSVPEDCGSFGF